MVPFRAGNSAHARAVHLDRIFAIRDEAVLGAAEIDCSLSFVDFVERAHIPIAIRDLLDRFSVGAVMIDMTPAAAIAEPQKRSIIQPSQAVVDSFDPRTRLFAK